MRVVGLHPDVLVATSRIWQTTCTIVRSGEEGFVIDSPVLPDELDVLPALLEQAQFPFSGLLATHADWDHLLARQAFPDAALGVAETTAARLTAEPGAAARELRAFDEDHYVERSRPLSLGQVQALPVPGHCEIGEESLELHAAEGHTEDGMAVWIGWARVLVCGDYLSPVEIPSLGAGGSVGASLATLRRLEPLVAEAAHVVPGHGAVMDSTRALAILREDVAYLEALPDAQLPLARRSATQRRAHAANVERYQHASSRSELAMESRSDSTRSELPMDARQRIHHVSLEVRLDVVVACGRFWGLLGFEPVAAPGNLGERSTWFARDGQQVHLLHAEEPVVPPEAHVAVVCPDYATVTSALRDAGFAVEARTEHWGSPRCFVRCPGGHRVEIMAFAPR